MYSDFFAIIFDLIYFRSFFVKISVISYLYVDLLCYKKDSYVAYKLLLLRKIISYFMIGI